MRKFLVPALIISHALTAIGFLQLGAITREAEIVTEEQESWHGIMVMEGQTLVANPAALSRATIIIRSPTSKSAWTSTGTSR